jgi:hypothetical protein
MNEAIEYHNQLFADLVENLQNAVAAGVMLKDEYKQHMTQAYLDLQERIAAELEIDEEDIYDVVGEAAYSTGDEVAEFSVGSEYGAALLELGEAAGYDDIEEYLIDLSDALECNPDVLLGIIEGEIAPTDNLSLALSKVLGLDEATENQLLVMGIESRGEDINDYLDTNEELDEEDQEADYATYQNSEFAEFKRNTEIKEALADVAERAYALVEAGKMTPFAVQSLLGNFSANERIAAFSTVCAENEVDPATQLYAMNTVLEIFDRMPAMEMGFFAEEVLDEEELDEEADLSSIAANYIKKYRS